MLFNSSIDAIVRYQKTRIPLAIFGPLAVFLCVASASGHWPGDPSTWGLNLVLALLLIVQFRLWDDLADVSHDRIHQPERVLCQTQSHQCFWGVVVGLLIINASLIAAFKSYQALAVFLALNLMFLVWYSQRQTLTFYHVISHAIVLTKYPAFVWLLSVSHSDGHERLMLFLGMTVTFLNFCAYELQHDARLRGLPQATNLLAASLSGLAFCAVLMLMDLSRGASSLVWVHAGLTLVGSGILVSLFQRVRAQTVRGLWHFAVFLVAFGWLLNFALASCLTFQTRRDSPAAVRGMIAIHLGKHS